MKIQVFVLIILLWVTGRISAQEINCEIQSPVVNVRQDSLVISWHMLVSVPDLEARGHVTLTPILSGQGRQTELPCILVNGKRAHLMYKREQMLQKRKKSAEVTGVYAAINPENQYIDYRTVIPVREGILSASLLSIRAEIFDEDGHKVKSTILSSREIEIERIGRYTSNLSNVLRDTTKVADLQIKPGKKSFKGCYWEPERDATDERNQKELDFSLEEAKVIANLKPHLLSLRELYMVALSYKDEPEKFYKIIETSVKIYPTNPVANLNAANAAIERGDIRMAGMYLQMALYDTIAYKNCRGVYELLCDNTYEGIRLLKSAKAEGCEEADHNLKLFFELNQ